MTAPAPTTPLTPAERRVAEHLVRGLAPREIAVETGLSAATIRQYIREMREKLHCPPRCPLPVLVHLLLVSGETAPLSTDKPAPDLSPDEQRLLRAVAEQSTTVDVALAARIAPADYRSALDALLAATETADAAELVALAHAWNLLGTGQNAAAPSGGSR
ncbi:MAG TPA: LuxR C-terminal-related transcriptional regulator [Actinomycetales bacterium]|nr:LuxR C-terminal-related transcriptional regulator [Actinomycetales bacterium]